MNPQERKRQDYIHQYRLRGFNSGSIYRKAWQRKKSYTNQSYRSKVKQTLRMGMCNTDVLDGRVRSLSRKKIYKCISSLPEHINQSLRRKVGSELNGLSSKKLGNFILQHHRSNSLYSAMVCLYMWRIFLSPFRHGVLKDELQRLMKDESFREMMFKWRQKVELKYPILRLSAKHIV